MQAGAARAQGAITYENLWHEGRWLQNATVRIDAAGNITDVSTETRDTGPVVAGLTVPGLVDAHCHAFQRALGAWTQRAAGARDDFWSWRETMYALAGRLERDDLEAISARCYLELLRGGYTAVAEFLYLHRLRGGRELDADAGIAAAARRTGMRLTLLPTLYQHADFGGAAPKPGQQPFARDASRFLEDWQELCRRYPAGGDVALGVAYHSLRAVDIETIARVQASLQEDARCRCVHIHVAEQPAEVTACLRQHGLPPVALLASRGLLSAKWALVHATQSSEAEFAQIRAAHATVVLCPTTEADLGDGCPVVAPFLEAGGQMAIGSDSNIGRSSLDELRQLEWSQRLARGRRNVFSTAAEPAAADRLFRIAHEGGQRAIGAASAGAADYVTYAAQEGDCDLQAGPEYLSALVFDAVAPRARHVLVGGRWLIRDGMHDEETTIEARYRETIRRLRPEILQWKAT
ncbi:MAG: amidohydrolase family protein [Steroidobacteraceae bacterium]